MSDLAKLHRDVVFGQSNGKIIWQPRIGCWYSDKQFAREPLPAPYTGMSCTEVYRSLACSVRLYEFNECFRRVEHPGVQFTRKKLNETDTEIVIMTPAGKQMAIERRSPSNSGVIHVKWEVETEEELKVATWREENTHWQWDQDRFDELKRNYGDLGAPTMFMPRMNIQCLYLEKMGIEKGIYALYDWPETVNAFFRALEACHVRLIDLINPSPIEIINFGENVHSSTLSPDLFKTWHLPACQRRCDKLHTAGKFVCSHWDGDCGPLLQFAKETGLDGIEAITPSPQGDVTIEEIKHALGDEMFLIDGIPAIYFNTSYSEATLIECTHQLINLFAPKLVLGISDEISSTGDIERVRLVGHIVDDYNRGI